ncbi:MAG: hypothetical protein K2O01_06065, partial [Bacteroidales bacterium]|nr:hypothetical protein [Bacteroidales bacterium]
MKNIRLLTGALCCGALWWGLTAERAEAQTVVTVPGNVALEVQTRTMTAAEAAQCVQNGDKVTLDVYLVLKDKGKWTDFLLKNDVFVGNNRISVAFYEDEHNMPSHDYNRNIYLQNPENYISICANSLMASVMPAGGCTAVTRGSEFGLKWYMEPVTWFETRKSSSDPSYAWPTYSYGGGNRGGLIETNATY